MNYLLQIKKYTDFLFIFFSILLFSFAPWLSLHSIITNIISKILYLFFFFFFFLSISISRYSKQKLKKSIPVILFIFIYSFIGLFRAGSDAFISSFVNFGIPLLILFYFYVVTDISINSKFVFILDLEIVICVLLNCFFSIYLICTFDGDLTSLYIAKADYVGYNYIRNNRLRAFGFLNSAVIFSNYLSVFFIYLISNLKRKKFFLLRLIFLLFIFINIYISGSRTPIISLFISTMMIIFFRNKIKYVPILSVLCIFFILLIVSFSGGLDLSALGRIKQYLDAFMLFIRQPLGYGFGYAGFPNGMVSFDCSILVILVNFGIIGLFILYKLYKKYFINNIKLNFGGCILVLNLFICSGFVNCIHLGILTLTVEIAFLIKEKKLKRRKIKCIRY